MPMMQSMPWMGMFPNYHPWGFMTPMQQPYGQPYVNGATYGFQQGLAGFSAPGVAVGGSEANVASVMPPVTADDESNYLTTKLHGKRTCKRCKRVTCNAHNDKKRCRNNASSNNNAK